MQVNNVEISPSKRMWVQISAQQYSTCGQLEYCSSLPSPVPPSSHWGPRPLPLGQVTCFGQWHKPGSELCVHSGAYSLAGLPSPWEKCVLTCLSRDSDLLENRTEIISFNSYHYPRRGSCDPILQMRKLRSHLGPRIFTPVTSLVGGTRLHPSGLREELGI